MSRFAVGFSEHPDAGIAAGEVCGAVLDGVGPAPDVAVLFVAAEHVGAFGDLVDAVHGIISPRLLVGTTACTVIGGHREVEDAPAVALWASDGIPGAVSAHLDVVDEGDGPELVGLREDLTRPGTLVLLADPFSFPAPAVLGILDGLAPELRVVGGMASASRQAMGNRLVVDRNVVATGAAALWFPATEPVTPVVSQGCGPIGDPFIVTDGDANQVRSLGGRPPAVRLQELLEDAGPEAEAQIRSGVHIGKVVDESKAEFGRGDFLVRGIGGIDRDSGAMLVGDTVSVGDTMQFHVRDAASATADLEALAAVPSDACLLFTCNGRGTHLFDVADHDARAVQEGAGPLALAGMACAGEFGPVGGRNFLHSFTASMALFGAGRAATTTHPGVQGSR